MWAPDAGHPSIDERDGDQGVATPFRTRLVVGAVLEKRYRLERCIGLGGMSEVWSATHLGLDREVALKLLRRESRAHTERLRTEAKLLASVRHPAIVEVHDFGTLPDGDHYLVMERLRGESLLAHVDRRGGILPAQEAVSLVTSILEGLEVVHAAGVVHRDLKPENVVLESVAGRLLPKLVDFGIALRPDQGDPRQTVVGSIVGTPAYLSPERASTSATADAAADIWAVGVMLYELVTGRLPFAGATMLQLLRAIVDAPLPYPRDLEPPLDGALFAILSTALRKEPALRYPSARAMREALELWQHGASPTMASPTQTRPTIASTAAPTSERPAEPSRAPTARTPLDTLIRTKLRRT